MVWWCVTKKILGYAVQGLSFILAILLVFGIIIGIPIGAIHAIKLVWGEQVAAIVKLVIAGLLLLFACVEGVKGIRKVADECRAEMCAKGEKQ